MIGLVQQCEGFNRVSFYRKTQDRRAHLPHRSETGIRTHKVCLHVLGLKLCIFELLSVRLHWRDWTELWLLTSATKSTWWTWSHCLGVEILLSFCLLHLLVELRASSCLSESLLSLVCFWWLSWFLQLLFKLIVQPSFLKKRRICTCNLLDSFDKSSNSSADFVLFLCCCVFLFLKMCSHLDIDLVVLLLSILMLVQFDRETLNNEAFSGLECFVGG